MHRSNEVQKREEIESRTKFDGIEDLQYDLTKQKLGLIALQRPYRNSGIVRPIRCRVIVWSANESPFRGRPLFGEPPLNLRVTGWFLTSHHFLLTQRKWFKLNAEIIIKYICHKKPVSFLLTLREKNLVISGQSVTVT